MSKPLKIIFPILFIGLLIWLVYSLIVLSPTKINLGAFKTVATMFALFFTALGTSIAWHSAKKNMFFYVLILSSLVLLTSIHLELSSLILLWKLEIGVLLIFSVFCLIHSIKHSSLALKITLYTTAGFLILPLCGFYNNFVLVVAAILCTVTTVWSITGVIRTKS